MMKKKLILAAAAVAVIAAVAIGAMLLRPSGTQGAKEVTVTVIDQTQDPEKEVLNHPFQIVSAIPDESSIMFIQPSDNFFLIFQKYGRHVGFLSLVECFMCVTSEDKCAQRKTYNNISTKAVADRWCKKECKSRRVFFAPT